MPLFAAHEYEKNTLRPTGRIEYYEAASLNEAVESCRYTQSCKHANVLVGPTGKVVHAGRFVYSLVPTRSRIAQNVA
jgi:hypothetical protein